MNGKTDNCFDAIRWILAFSLLCFHFSRACDEPLFWPITGKEIVEGFFILSGFLTYHSFCIKSNIKLYFKKRIKRILPAYTFTIVCCIIIGILFTNLPIKDFFKSPETLYYIFANITFANFIHPTLPEVFTNQKIPVINASLWTMKIEILFYLLLPLIILLIKRFKPLVTLITCYILSAGYDLVFIYLYRITGNDIYETLRHQIGGQFIFFFSGMIIYQLFNFIMRYKIIIIIGSSILFIASYFTIYLRYIEPLCYASILIIIAYSLTPLNKFSRLPQLTYEIYLLHFPIFQSLIALNMLHYGFFFTFILGILLTFLLAYSGKYIFKW